MASNYSIRDDYQINAINRTVNKDDEQDYWTADRIQLSGQYQFSVYRKAREIAEIHRLKTILDVGCGVATKLEIFFKAFEVFGVDQEASIRRCLELNRQGTFIAEDIQSSQHRLHKHLRRADLIICSDVIEHVSHPESLLDYIKTFADQQTWIIISTPERDSLCGKNAIRPHNPFHIREWSFGEFADFLSSSGFTIMEHYTDFSFSFGWNKLTMGFLLNRMMQRLPLKTNQIMICRKNP
jgi:SAM-dependent methyltransferase